MSRTLGGLDENNCHRHYTGDGWDDIIVPPYAAFLGWENLVDGCKRARGDDHPDCHTELWVGEGWDYNRETHPY